MFYRLRTGRVTPGAPLYDWLVQAHGRRGERQRLGERVLNDTCHGQPPSGVEEGCAGDLRRATAHDTLPPACAVAHTVQRVRSRTRAGSRISVTLMLGVSRSYEFRYCPLTREWETFADEEI